MTTEKTENTPQTTRQENRNQRMERVTQVENGEKFLITLKNGDMYSYKPEKEHVIKFLFAHYPEHEANEVIDNERLDISYWHFFMRDLHIRYHRDKWCRLHLKEVPLVERVERAVNKKAKLLYKKTRFVCTKIDKHHTRVGSLVVIEGHLEGKTVNVQGFTLKEAVQNMIDKVLSEATPMTLQEMKDML